MNSKFLRASDMILVGEINRQEIEEIINHLISSNEFDQILRKIIDD